MKKYISILSLTLGLLVSTIAFVACGSSDDDSTGGNSSDKQSSKHIIKIIEEEGGSIYESTFTYDSQGRVIKIIESESSGEGTNSHSEKTYQYGETVIITKEITQESWSNGQIFSSSESHSFTLENGLIIKDEERQSNNTNSSTHTYNNAYNADGYLISITESGSGNNNSKEVKWTDGNITNIGYNTFTYSNVPWVKGFPFYLKGSNMDSYLFAIGYYGIIPKYLPSQYSSSETSGSRYDFTLQDNLVIKIIATPFVENNKHNKTTITIVWE